MKKIFSGAICAGILFFGIAVSVNATLLTRLGGMAVYDTDLNITWLADANAGAGSSFDNGASNTDGRMTWDNANAWAASLSIGGFNDWRLPTTLQPDTSCSSQASNGTSSGFNCTGSEMGHMFYDELSGTAGNPISSTLDPDISLFSNVASLYWSETGYAFGSNAAWGFFFSNGLQGLISTDTQEIHAWAVRTGDVLTVPEPSILALSGLGFLGMFGFTRRKQ